MMNDIDPRQMPNVVDEHGDCIDLAAEERMLLSAIAVRALSAFPHSSQPDNRTEVSVESLLPWLEASGEPLSIILADGLRPSPSSVLATPRTPQPIPTSQLAHCFEGLRWTEAQWKKALGDKPKWLGACVAVAGARGISETKWNPVQVGAALVHARHVKPNRVRARFQSNPLLSHWLDAWKTYEAEYLDPE